MPGHWNVRFQPTINRHAAFQSAFAAETELLVKPNSARVALANQQLNAANWRMLRANRRQQFSKQRTADSPALKGRIDRHGQFAQHVRKNSQSGGIRVNLADNPAFGFRH